MVAYSSAQSKGEGAKDNGTDSVVEAIAKHAQDQADKKAIITQNAFISYSALWDRILLFSQYLIKLGAKRGDCVLIEETHSIDFCVVEFSTHLLGCIFVSIDRRLSLNKIQDLIRITRSEIIFGKICNGAIPLNEAMSEASGLSWKKSIPSIPNGNEPSDIIFTTGTTGEAKGIVHTHRSQYATAENFIDLLNISEDSNCAITTPLSHLHGVRRMNGTLIAGGTVILTGGAFPPIQLLRLVQTHSEYSGVIKTGQSDFPKTPHSDSVRTPQSGTTKTGQSDFIKTPCSD